jgi:hypothetical protein
MASAFAAGFFGRLAEISAEERQAEREREARMEAIMEQRKTALLPAIIKRQMSVEETSRKFENSVKALSARLRDEEGNLIEGAQEIISDPSAAHLLYQSITEEEKRAAEKGLPVTRFSPQDIVDNSTVYSSETGKREVLPSISFDDLLTGNFSLEEGYRIALSGEEERPEPVVEFMPQVNVDPAKLEEGREIWKSRVLRKFNERLVEAKDTDPELYTELFTLKESFDRDPKGPALTQVEDLFGTQVYREMMEENSDYFRFLERDPFFSPIRQRLESAEQRVETGTEMPQGDAVILQQIISDPNATEEEKTEAKELLQIILGK